MSPRDDHYLRTFLRVEAFFTRQCEPEPTDNLLKVVYYWPEDKTKKPFENRRFF